MLPKASVSFSSPAPSLSLAKKFPWVLTDAVLNVRQLLAKLGFVCPKPVLHWHLLFAPPKVHLPCQTSDLSSPGSLLQWKCSVQRFIHYSKACSKVDMLGSYLPPRAREAGRALPIQPKHNASMKQRRKVTSSTCTAGLTS